MKKILAILGFVVFAIFTVFASDWGYTYYKSSQYKETALPYVEMVIPEISKWDTEIIKQHMPPESLQNTSDEKIKGIVLHLSRLGDLEKFEKPEFSKIYSVGKAEEDQRNIVSYTVEADYENGDATIDISVLEGQEKSFHVHNFMINSSALSE